MLLPQLFISYFIISKQCHYYGNSKCYSPSNSSYNCTICTSLYGWTMIATADCRFLHCFPVVVYMNVCFCSCIPVSCTFHTDHCGGAVHFLAHSASAVALGCGGEPWWGMSCTLGPSPPSCFHWTMCGHTAGTCTPQTFSSGGSGRHGWCIMGDVVLVAAFLGHGAVCQLNGPLCTS